MDGSRWQPLKPVCSSRHFGFPTGNFQYHHSGPLAEEHCDRWIHQAILAISLDLAGSEGFVRRYRVVKQHDMFQENFEHVPRILFARSCVLVGVFFRELLCQAEHATACRSFKDREECFCRVYEQQRSMKIDLLRTASVFVPASSRQGSILSLAVPRWKRFTSARRATTQGPIEWKRELTQNSRAGNPKRLRPNCQCMSPRSRGVGTPP